MPVTNPLAIKFSNEGVRPLAESFTRTYYDCVSFLDFWETNNGDSAFPAGAGAVDDNAALDGRTPLTSDDVRNLKAFAEAFVTSLTANSNEQLQVVIKPSVRIK